MIIKSIITSAGKYCFLDKNIIAFRQKKNYEANSRMLMRLISHNIVIPVFIKHVFL